jgi:hypothetical protein
MRRQRTATISDLRQAIDCLPRRTRTAMLDGIATNPIIVGAYTSPDGICPMLAAHRAGGRTSLIAFADAWDRYAFRSSRRPRSRRATERELLVLRSHLQASLLADEVGADELTGARREHERLIALRRHDVEVPPTRRERQRPGDPYRGAELSRRRGWAWTRIVRRLDDYQRLVAEAQAAADTADSCPHAEGVVSV